MTEEERRISCLAYRYALNRIAGGGEGTIYNGNWIVYTKEDLQLIAHEALAGKPPRDALEIQKARKFAMARESEDDDES